MRGPASWYCVASQVVKHVKKKGNRGVEGGKGKKKHRVHMCMCVCVTHTHISHRFLHNAGHNERDGSPYSKVYDLALSTQHDCNLYYASLSRSSDQRLADWAQSTPREGAHCCVAAIHASPRTRHIITCPPGFGARTFQPGRRAQGERSEAVAHRRDTHPSVRGGRGRRWQGRRGRGR